MLGLLVAFFLALKNVSVVQAAPRLTASVAVSDASFSATRAVHTISFGTVNDVPDGTIRFLVPAINTSSEANDGVADAGFYDFNSAMLQCPANIPGFEFATGLAIPVNTGQFVYQGRPYHVFSCAYTGSGSGGSDFGIVSGAGAQISGLINPAPAPGNTYPDLGAAYSPGTALFVPWLVQQVNQYGVVVNSLVVWPNYIDDVLVNVEIPPYFTFVVSGVAGTTPACGITTTHPSSATLVDFQEISDNAFVDMAQELYLATNYPDGYVVTISSNDQMSRFIGNNQAICPGKNGVFDDCLSNATVAGMSPTTGQIWTSPSQGSGLAYTLANISGEDNVFDYTSGWRHLPDAEAGDAPVRILELNDSNESYNHVCYRLNSAFNNLPGTYENQVTYTATASF